YSFTGGPINGATSLAKNGTGSLTLSAANGYTGGTTLNAGTLTVGNDGSLGTGGLTLNGGTIAGAVACGTVANNPITLGADVTFGGPDLTFSKAASLTGHRTLTVNNTTTFDGVISQLGNMPFGFTKAGAGTLVLSGSNTYQGDTT